MTNAPPQTTHPTKAILLNASSLKLTHCQLRYHHTVVQGLVPPETQEVLIFGKAVHRYTECRSRGTGPAAAMAHALAEYEGGLYPEKLALACAARPPDDFVPYRDAGGREYVELKFKVYWRSIFYNGVQYDIYVCGTMDLVSMLADGSVLIRDYKTTRRRNPAEVFADYGTSVQMYFYLWVAQRFGYSIFDMTVANAAYNCRIMLQVCGVFLSATTPFWKHGPFISIDLPRLNHFESVLDHTISHTILPAWDTPVATGRVNDTCSGCEFVNSCFAPSSEQGDQILSQYKRTTYDPSTW